MKRSSFRRPDQYLLSRRGVPTALLLVALAFIIIIVRSVFPGAFMYITAPLFSAGTAVTSATNALVGSFIERAANEEARAALQEMNTFLRNENRALLAQIQDTAGFVGVSPTERSFVLAGVIARPPVSAYDTLVVEIGETTEVLPGAQVYAPGFAPLGEVEQVAAGTVRVRLYSAPGNVSEGWVGETRIPLTLRGEGAGAFFAEVPNGTPVSVGDIVYLPGPGALPIGSVARVDTSPSSPVTVLRIAPTVNVFSLTWVAIDPARL